MLFAYFDLLSLDVVAAFVLFGAVASALLAGISFHEFSHAYIADRLGDRLPRSLGRVTLNPLAHLDPAGTILLFLVGFGWGKPVPVNPYATQNPRASFATVAAGGPLSNFLVAAVAGLPLNLGLVPWLPPFNTGVINSLIRGEWGLTEYVGLYLSAIVLISLILGVFNLIPLAPLDGFRVALGVLPEDLSRSFAQTERWGPAILLILIALPILSGGELGILFEVMRPVINALAKLFAGIDGDVYS